MKLTDLTDLYAWIRKNNQHTPDDVVDFMYQAAKEKFLKLQEKPIQKRYFCNFTAFPTVNDLECKHGTGQLLNIAPCNTCGSILQNL